MHILGCFTLLLILVVMLLMLAPVVLLNLVRRLFGTKQKHASNKWGNNSQQSQHQQHSQTSSARQKRKENKKIFERNEGEYVDFEEVKD